jgi:MFS family permease
MNCAMGANMPGYYKLIAKTIPPHLRGRLYGIGGAIQGVLGVGAAGLAGWFLAHWGFPTAYAACFFGAFVLQSLSVTPLAFMREPVQAAEDTPPHLGVRGTLGIVRSDPRLRGLLGGMVFYSVNQVAGAFFTLFAIQRFGVGEAGVGVFTAVVMGAKTIAFLLTGWLGDRFGNRIAIAVAAVCGTAAAGAAWVAPEAGWMYAVFILNEIAAQGWGVCASNYVLELCPPERAGTYTAVYGAVSGPFRVGLPLLAGALIAALGFKLLFALSALGGLAALWVVLTRLTEPRHEPARHAAAAECPTPNT